MPFFVLSFFKHPRIHFHNQMATARSLKTNAMITAPTDLGLKKLPSGNQLASTISWVSICLLKIVEWRWEINWSGLDTRIKRRKKKEAEKNKKFWLLYSSFSLRSWLFSRMIINSSIQKICPCVFFFFSWVVASCYNGLGGYNFFFFTFDKTCSLRLESPRHMEDNSWIFSSSTEQQGWQPQPNENEREESQNLSTFLCT